MTGEEIKRENPHLRPSQIKFRHNISVVYKRRLSSYGKIIS